jgi:hypothetical protein
MARRTARYPRTRSLRERIVDAMTHISAYEHAPASARSGKFYQAGNAFFR